MSRVYIQFQSEADEVKGYYALGTQASVDSLLGEIFCVSEASLQILEKEQVKYTLVPDPEVRQVYQKLRAFWNEKSQKGIKSKIKKIKRWARSVFANSRTEL